MEIIFDKGHKIMAGKTTKYLLEKVRLIGMHGWPVDVRQLYIRTWRSRASSNRTRENETITFSTSLITFLRTRRRQSSTTPQNNSNIANWEGAPPWKE